MFSSNRLTAKQKKSKAQAELLSKKMLGLDKYEEEKKQKERWFDWSQSKGQLLTAAVVAAVGVAFGGYTMAQKANLI